MLVKVHRYRITRTSALLATGSRRGVIADVPRTDPLVCMAWIIEKFMTIAWLESVASVHCSISGVHTFQHVVSSWLAGNPEVEAALQAEVSLVPAASSKQGGSRHKQACLGKAGKPPAHGSTTSQKLARQLDLRRIDAVPDFAVLDARSWLKSLLTAESLFWIAVPECDTSDRHHRNHKVCGLMSCCL